MHDLLKGRTPADRLGLSAFEAWCEHRAVPVPTLDDYALAERRHGDGSTRRERAATQSAAARVRRAEAAYDEFVHDTTLWGPVAARDVPADSPRP